jgi:hypothetical protein
MPATPSAPVQPKNPVGRPPKVQSVLDVTVPPINRGQAIADAVQAYMFAWEGRMDPQKDEAKAKLVEAINAAFEK